MVCALFALGLAAEAAEAQRGGRVRRAIRALKPGKSKTKQRSLRPKRDRTRSNRLARKRDLPTRNKAAKEAWAEASKLSRTAQKARKSSEAKRNLDKSFTKRTRELMNRFEKLQNQGSLDPVTEHRLSAAIGRALNAAREINPELVPEKQQGKFERLYSNATYRRLRKNHETSIEIEAGMTPQIFDAITTKDGTVKPVLEEGGNKPPEFLKKMADGGAVEKVKWNQLNSDQKLELLRSQTRGQDFFANRRIPGVVFRRDIAKPRGKSVTLGGNEAGASERKVNVDNVLMRKVEHLGPTTVKKVNGVEFHVRQKARASKNVKDAWALNGLFGRPKSKNYGHQHIPNRLPKKVLRGDPVKRAALVDFYRRANMAAELRAVLDGSLLQPVRKDNVVFFDFLKSGGLKRLNEHFHGLSSRGSETLRNSELKMGAVGFRKGSLYGNKNMFGFEVRTLGQNKKEMGTFVDAVQRGVLTGHYGVKSNQMQRWHAKNVGKKGKGSRRYLKKQGEVLSGLHYNRSVGKLLSGASAEIKPLLTDKVKTALQEKADKHYGLKMLIHDFSRDPALQGSGKGKQRAKVLEAQKEGLRALERGGDPSKIVRNFAKNSGLYEVYARSIGMRDPTLQSN